MEFSAQYSEYLTCFENALKEYTAGMEPSVLTESMRYSLLSGGKRVRPVLFYSALDLLKLDYKKEFPLALALECIHTYSLIHDDLPAMDNDDFRRGNPSNHKVYGEANAILAGDGLLSLAASILIAECGKGEAHRTAAAALMYAAGINGMVLGQSKDLYYTNKEASLEELFTIYEKKTAMLLAAPLKMAACLAGRYMSELEEFGLNLGFLFQITDDILDVEGESETLGKSTGKDEKENKLTCVRLCGLTQAQLFADRYADKCSAILEGIDGSEFFESLVRYIRTRNR